MEVLKTRFWLDVSRLWHMPWNLSLSMWEPSAAWPYLEENDRTLLLAIDNAWTRQWAWRGVQQFTPCFWQQLCLHHLKINVIQIKQTTRICYHFLVWALFFFFLISQNSLSLMSWRWLFQWPLQVGLLDLWSSRNVKKAQLRSSIAWSFPGFLIAVKHDGRARASSIICILFLKESRKTAVFSVSVWLYYIPGNRVALDVPCALLLHTTESISNLIFSSLLLFFLFFFFFLMWNFIYWVSDPLSWSRNCR